jgi:predicted HTH domain antitoxin
MSAEIGETSLMNTLVVEYPESLPDCARLSRQEFEQAMRLALASKLFELGRLSSGHAAALVPTDRYSFLRSLSQVGVPAIDWSPDEFDDEITHA